MNKKSILTILATASCLALSATVLAMNKGNSRKLLSFAEKIQPGSITIDASDPNLNVEYGYFEVKSELGNDFGFHQEDVTKANGKFNFTNNGYIKNYSILNGITSLGITVDESVTLDIKYQFNEKNDYDEQSVTLTTGYNYVTFNDYHPNFFMIGDESFNFSISKIVINYECQADTPQYEILEMQSVEVGGYSLSNADGVLAPIGASLSSLNICRFEICDANYFYMNFEQMPENFTIHYNNSNSSTVLSGTNKASVSFMYGGCLYSSTNVDLIGYGSVDFNAIPSSGYLSSNEIRAKENDNLPNDLLFGISGNIVFYDENDNQVYTCNAWDSEIQITQQNLVLLDTNPFTDVGKHTMVVLYEGMNVELSYEIFDPDYCNIRHIDFNESLRVPVGTSNEDFLTYVLSLTAYVSYYEIDKEDPLPPTVTLTAANFILAPNMFANAGYYEVEINYGNYTGTVYVQAYLEAGNEVKTYTNTNGVEVFGANITGIVIYDNDTCQFVFNDSYPSDVYPYTRDGDIISVNFEGMPLNFEVDDVNDTFVKPQKTANVVKQIYVDFQALGAPDTLYDGTIYDDDTIVFTIEGMDIECAFTIDPNDANIYYFTFVAGQATPCKGTLDPLTDIMVVEPIAQP